MNPIDKWSEYRIEYKKNGIWELYSRTADAVIADSHFSECCERHYNSDVQQVQVTYKTLTMRLVR